jgi:CHAD domain-containing protein
MASRAYRFAQGEALADGVVRVAEGRIDHAVDHLRGPDGGAPEEAVHEARKDTKKLRALLRLVRGELPGKVYRREANSFRDAGRQLAGVRDADVMLATLGALEPRLPADVAGDLRQALEAHRIRTAAGALGPAAQTAVEILSEVRARVGDWPLGSDGFDGLEDGLRRIYRQGRRAHRAARKDPSVEDLHGWRKRVKDLWYHLSLLEIAWQPVMSALADEAHELSDRLGDDHDLAVLLAWAREHATAPDELTRAVESRRAELQAEAFEYGARLYADKPGVFVDRVARWWETSARAAGAEAAHH